LDWRQDEKEFVKERYGSKSKEAVLPELMCPDDCNLLCTVIVAKVVTANGIVMWDKISVDMNTREEMMFGYDCIGSKVEWFDKIPPFVFEEEEYK